MFTLLAGSTEERILVHEAVLAGSPVFRAMTRLPFKEKEEQTIRLPDDEASHVRCLVAFLYTGGFSTQTECDLRGQEDKDTKKEGEGPSSGTGCRRQTGFYLSKDRILMLAPDLEMPVAAATVQKGTEPLTAAERAVAEDLAQIFMLGDKYQLPEVRRCALQKLDKWFEPSKYPIRLLYLVTILNLHIPESNSQFRIFVQTNLQQGVPRSRDESDRVIKSIIENGFMRQSAELAEEILRAYAYYRVRSDPGSDSEDSTNISSNVSLSEARRRLQRIEQ